MTEGYSAKLKKSFGGDILAQRLMYCSVKAEFTDSCKEFVILLKKRLEKPAAVW
jgi:hypothetical protein